MQGFSVLKSLMAACVTGNQSHVAAAAAGLPIAGVRGHARARTQQCGGQQAHGEISAETAQWCVLLLKQRIPLADWVCLSIAVCLIRMN